MHMTHNFDPVPRTQLGAAELLVAGKEGVIDFIHDGKGWSSRQLVGKRGTILHLPVVARSGWG